MLITMHVAMHSNPDHNPMLKATCCIKEHFVLFNILCVGLVGPCSLWSTYHVLNLDIFLGQINSLSVLFCSSNFAKCQS